MAVGCIEDCMPRFSEGVEHPGVAHERGAGMGLPLASNGDVGASRALLLIEDGSG